MFHAKKFLALALALGAAQSVSAGWFETKFSGNSCHTKSASLPVVQTRYGLYNPSSSSAAEVICPLQVPYAKYTYGYIGVSAYRRNPNDGMSCTLHMTNDDGTAWATAYASIPTYGPSRQYGTRYTNPSVGSDVVWVECHIPASYVGNNSYLNAISINLNGG